MIFLEELNNLQLYKKQFYLPIIDNKDKKKNSSIFLLTPNYESSKNILNSNLIINRYFTSYYIEKDITYYINQEGYIDISNIPYNVIREDVKDEIMYNILTEELQWIKVKNEDNPLYKYLGKEDDKEGYSYIPISNNPGINKADKSSIGYYTDISGKHSKEEDLYNGKMKIENLLTEMTYDFNGLKNINSIEKLEELKKNSKITNKDSEDTAREKAYYHGYINRRIYQINKSKQIQNINENNIIEESKLSSKDRKDLSNEDYGIPELRKYPLIDKEHVLMAIRFFNKVDKQYEKELAKNIIKKMQEYNMTKVIVGDANRFYRYYRKSSLFNESCIDGDIEEEFIGLNHNEYQLEETHLRVKTDGIDTIVLFNECTDEQILEESNKEFNPILHKLLYNERFKTPREVVSIYDKVKIDLSWITKTYLDYNKYKELNLIIDLSFYNQTFFKNNMFKLDKGVELYFEFINRFIQDKRLESAGYTKKTIFIPVVDWDKPDVQVFNYTKDINPISMINRLIKTNLSQLQTEWKDIDFVFMSNTGYFKVQFDKLSEKDSAKFQTLISKLEDVSFIPDDPDMNQESPKAITANIIDKIETSQNVEIKSLTGNTDSIDKNELVDRINKAAIVSNNTDEAIDTLEQDNQIKNIIDSLAAEAEDNVKINAARTARINKLQDDFLNKKLNNTTIKQMLQPKPNDDILPVTSLELDTINDEWKSLKYTNFEKHYNVQEDILRILNSFSKRTVPVAVRDIEVIDSSTSEDYIETYIVKMEDVNGQRFTLKFDVPKLIDDKFMMLRGNEKTIQGQEMLLPITKTDENTAQIVSNYKKIFIERFGTSSGKSFVTANRILKALGKDTYSFKVILGDNTRICSKYELPMDYIDLASQISRIEHKDFIIYFNQDEIRNTYKDKIDLNKGIPYIYDFRAKQIIYYGNTPDTFSNLIYYRLCMDKKFMDVFDTTSVGTKYTYSKASILNTQIPVIVIMAYSEGLTTALKKANVEFELSEKRGTNKDGLHDYIKFKDGYLNYTLTYNSSLLVNGLKECNTEDYSLKDINSKNMYLDFLELFGGRLKADGLDNFYDLMIDPITEEVLEYFKLPIDYIECLAYANYLLQDNKYIKQTDLTSKRYRSNEIIAGYVYQVLSESYGEYRTSLKKNRKGSTMTVKQSAVIDRILLDPTASDLSTLNALLDLECINAVSPKGLSGMNADRSYGLDKRTYDESMLGILGLSTGFAGNVGITRQAVLDMNIEGKRGYFKITKDPNVLNTTKAFTATEAVTPFGTTRDDPFRSAMTFIQTSKHGMRVQKAMPLLVSNGADQALPYLISNKFAFKARQDGKIIEKTDEYMIIQYKDKTNDFIDLRAIVKKNSDGGFFVTLKLDSDLNKGQTVKQNQIIAYDKMSFSDEVGHTGDLAYMNSTNVKVAVMNTDEGYEDSSVISEWLSEAMSSDVVLMKDITLPKSTNIYNMAKKGQLIQEGDPLLIFQNAFDDEDANSLLKNLAGDEEFISEIGRIPVKSKITGIVEDVKMYRTVDKEELSDSLKKKINELEKPLNDIAKIMEKYDIDKANTYKADKLDAVGKLKNAKDSVLIEFYLKYHDKMSVGDKLVYYSALKGVIKGIFPKGKEPYTDFRPDEKIHSLLSLGSISGRMVCSVMIVGGINKVLIELDRQVKDMAGIKFKYLDED